ncbi:MAG: hypothetical protein AB2A00_02125 [Myxococcota bacterium]
MDSARWVVTAEGVSVNQFSSKLSVYFPANGEQDPHGGVTTTLRYDVRGSYASVKVDSVGGEQIAPSLAITDPDNLARGFMLERQAGELVFMVDGVEQARAAFVPGTDVWWRIREASGVVYCDTSADGANWATRLSVISSQSALDLSRAVVALQARHLSGGPGDGSSARFTNYNGGGVPAEPFCPSLSFSQDLTRPLPDPDFTFEGTCPIAATPGGLSFTIPGTACSSAYSSATAYNLVDSAVFVELSDGTNASAYMGLEVRTADGLYAASFSRVSGGGFYEARTIVPGMSSPVRSDMLGGVQHLWLKIAQEGTLLVWYYSSDGLTWIAFASTIADTPFSDVRIKLFFSSNGQPNGSSALFNHLNTSP